MAIWRCCPWGQWPSSPPSVGVHSLTSLVATLAFKCCLLAFHSFFFFSSLFLSVWKCVGTEISITAAHLLTETLTQPHSLISQCGQAPSAPRSCGEQVFGPSGSMESSVPVTRKYRQMLWSALSRRIQSQWPRTCHNHIYNSNVIMVW